MNANIFKRLLITLSIVVMSALNMMGVTLWVGQSYTWDFSGSVMGSTYNMSVTSNGGYLSVTGSGFYRNIKPTQYFSGTATVTAEWDYTLYYGGPMTHQKVTLSVTCNENPVSISPTSVTLSPGQTYQLRYSHRYQNDYVGASGAYFSGGNSSFTVSESGLVTAIAPGSGYVNVYSKISSASSAPYCLVTVKDVEPTGASVGNISMLAGQSRDLSVNVSPSNATVKSKTWYVKSGEDIISISGQTLRALNPGTATIYCIVNGSVRSNEATVTVTEPTLACSKTLPEDNAIDVSVFNLPTVTYSHEIQEGKDFGSIALTSNARSRVDGIAELSDNSICFSPTHPLESQTTYTLTIPRNAVVNKWGSPAEKDIALTFTTGERDKVTLNVTPSPDSFLTVDEGVVITADPSDATIYYTIDGSQPTTDSAVYSEPIKSDGNFTLKAFASREGYDDSEVITADYYKSMSEILGYYPQDAQPLFKYALVNPWLRLSGQVMESNNFRRISMKDGAGNNVAGEAYITHYLIVFVPEKPLENCMEYTMDIPYDAVRTANGEVFKGFSWTFTTPVMPMDIAMRGDESAFVLNEDGSLQIAGMEYLTTSIDNGSFTYKDTDRLTQSHSDVDAISAGYTHRLIRKGAAVAGAGLAMCGETGDTASITSIGDESIIKAGFQTSAIIDDEGSLWMCGRNDFGQLGNGSDTTLKEFVNVAENVVDVAPGNSFTLYVDGDNVLWGVGRNHKGQLGDGTTEDRIVPVKIMEDVAKVYASTSGYFSACITTTGSLLTWGDNSSSQLGRDCDGYSASPEVVMENVMDASLGESHILALGDDYKLYAWGSNRYGQIGTAEKPVTHPTVMADNIVAACAGPNTSLIMEASGRIAGFGRKSHANFGSGNGIAFDYELAAAQSYSPLFGVDIEPSYFEHFPDQRFALLMKPRLKNADYDTVEWSSDNPAVAEVDSRGVVQTNAHGTAVITVKVTDKTGRSKTAEATIVCTDDPDYSGVDSYSVGSGSWSIYSEGLTIVITGATPGDTFALYSPAGIELQSAVATDSTVTFSTTAPGVYLIRSAKQVAKVLCH